MAMTVVNARVEAADVKAARRVLDREGLTLSWAIRTVIEYIARTDGLPPLVLDEAENNPVAVARETTDFFESLPFAEPPAGWGDVTLDRQLIDEERMRHFG